MPNHNFRRVLEDTLERNLQRLQPRSDSTMPSDRFERVVVVDFSMQTARDVTKHLMSQGKELKSGTLEQVCMFAAAQRIDSAWSRMPDPAPDSLEGIEREVIQLLTNLSSPSDDEKTLASTCDASILKATTNDYREILKFLKDRLQKVEHDSG